MQPIKMLPVPKIKYERSKKNNVFCLVLYRKMGNSGCVNIVGNDQRARHRATLPAVPHLFPKNKYISLSPPQDNTNNGKIEIIVTTLKIFFVIVVRFELLLLSSSWQIS